MRILFITDNFYPETNAPAIRTHEHCARWVKSGASVTVLTCAPNFPGGKVFPGYKNRLYQTEEMDGIRVVRVWSYMAANTGVFRRSADYASFAFSAFWAGLFQKADIVVATSPQFFTTWAGWGLSWIRRKPFVFELRDLWPESISAVGAMRKGFFLKFLEKIELFLYRRAEAVVAVNSGLKDNLVRRGVQENKIHVIPNGVDKRKFNRGPQNGKEPPKLGLGKKFLVSYIGTHGMAHGLDFIVRSLSGLRDQDIHFLFIGGGAKKDELQKEAEDLSLENCTFLDPVPRSRVPDYLALSDAALVHLKDLEVFRDALPSKIFEAAAMQVPILLGVDGLARNILEKYGAGSFFQPGNRESFFRALTRLKEDRNFYESCREGCAELAADFDRERMADEMFRLLSDICAEKRG